MKRLLIVLALTFPAYSIGRAQTPVIEDVDRLLDYSQTTFSDLLFPPATTGQAEALGSMWFYRDYGYLAPIAQGTGVAIAINISGGGDFNVGDVIAIGGPYNNVPTFIDSFPNLLQIVPETFESGSVSAITSEGNGECIDITPVEGSMLRRFEETIAPSTTVITSLQAPLYHYPGVTYLGGEETLQNGNSISSFNIEHFILITIEDGLQTLQEEQTTYAEISPSPGNEFTVTVTYEGGLFQGPAYTFCDEQSWYSAPTTKTVTTSPASNPPGDSIEQIPATTVTVDSLFELVTEELDGTESNYTAPLSTFRTRAVSSAGTTLRWYLRDRGVMVKEEIYDQNDALLSSKTLTSLYISNQ